MPSGKQYEMLFKLNAQQNSGFKTAFSQAQAEFARLGGQIQSLQKVQGDISSYQKQELAIQRTVQRLESLQKQQEAVERQLQEARNAGKSTAALEEKELKLEESVRKANVSLENQQNRLSAAANRLNAAGIGTDGLAGKSRELSARMEDLTQRQKEAALAAEEYGRTAKSSFELAGEALASAGLAAGMKQVGEAYLSTVQAAGEFAASMSNAEALSGANAQEIAALRAQAKELGADTQFTANQSAQAMGYMGMAGWNAQQMLAGMPGVIDLAAASGEDLASVSDIVTDSLTGFGMAASETQRFVDVLAAASSKSNTTVSMLGESFKYVAPLAGTLGYTVEDTAVLLGLMANSGIKASQAGTTLRTSLSNMISPTKEQAAEMERLGISLTGASGEMLPLLDMTGILRDRFSGMSEAEQSAAASTLFGKEAMSGMLAIINASEADYQSLTQSIYNSAGAAEHMAKIKLDNLQGDITLLQSAWDGLGITIGEQFMPQWRSLAQAGTGVIGWVNQLVEQNPVLVKALMAGAGAVGAVTTAVLAFNAAKKAMAVIDLASMFAGPVGPIMLAVSGAAALAAGVIGISDAALSAWPNVDELTRSAQNLEEALQDAAGGYEASQTGLAATAGLADHYLDRLEALDSVTHKTQEQQEQCHATLAMLAETVPELAGSIDLTTDSIEGGTAALRRQTAAWEENAKAQAYQEALKEVYAAQAQAELEHEQNLVKLQSAQADVRDIEEQRAELMARQTALAKEYGFTYEEAMNGQAAWAGHSAERIQALTEKHVDLESRIHQLDGALDKARGNVGVYSQAVEKSAPILSQAEQKAKDMAAALEGLTGSAQESAHAVDEARDSVLQMVNELAGQAVWGLADAGAQLGLAAGEASLAYTETYAQAYQSISGQIGLFEKMSVEVETSVGDMMAALESQAACMSEYAANLQKAAEMGLSQGLLAQLSDGSTESAAYLQEIVTNGQGKIGELNAAFAKVQEGKEDFSRTVAEMQTDLKGTMDEAQQTVSSAVEEMNLYSEAAASARATMQGFIDGANGMADRVWSAYRGVALGAIGAIQGAVGAGISATRGYASGTQNAAPGFALVGEQGPELVLFQGGEQVLDASETAALSRRAALTPGPLSQGPGSGPVTVQVYFQITGSASPETVEQLREYGGDIEEKIVRVLENLLEDKARRSYQ